MSRATPGPLDSAHAVTKLPARDLERARPPGRSSTRRPRRRKGTGELGAFFLDSEGNLIGLGQATRS